LLHLVGDLFESYISSVRSDAELFGKQATTFCSSKTNAVFGNCGLKFDIITIRSSNAAVVCHLTVFKQLLFILASLSNLQTLPKFFYPLPK
jgi:hypothetical protein